MAYTGDKWYAQQYQDAVMQLAQQKGSALRNAVWTKEANSEKVNFERLAGTAAVAKTTRAVATPNVEMVHDRRVVTLVDYHWATQHDWFDDVRMLVDPKGPYTAAGGWAMGRAIDDLIIAAVRNAWHARAFEMPYMVSLGKDLCRLVRDDYDRLSSIMRRISS